jgi:hypothetical protein
MRDHQHRFSPCFQVGQQLRVKHLAEERILIGCPLVEQIEGTVFHVGRQEGEPLTLSLREGLRRKQSSFDPDFGLELQSLQIDARHPSRFA